MSSRNRFISPDAKIIKDHVYNHPLENPNLATFLNTALEYKIPFTPVDQFDFNFIDSFHNQLIFIMKNGTFDVCPRKTQHKGEVVAYMGFRFHSIRYVGVLPSAESKLSFHHRHNPARHKTQEGRDLYETISKKR